MVMGSHYLGEELGCLSDGHAVLVDVLLDLIGIQIHKLPAHPLMRQLDPLLVTRGL